MLDPRHLKPVAFVRLLNSTDRGTVISARQLRRHRERAGYQIGDDETVDLFRYAAWLTLEYLRPPEERQSYEETKRREAETNRARVAAAQDIGEIPPIANSKRRAAAEASLRKFCETYFPDVFFLPWSDDHLLVLERIERVVRQGGLFAIAMPRGSGKTTLCQMGVLWAALTAATPFVCLIAASATMAIKLMDEFKIWLETNVPLGADFPEVCYPIGKLERITNRQRGQKHKGKPTRIEWNADQIVLPTIEGSRLSGIVISCSGMEGAGIRGQKRTRPDGQTVRPQLVLIDDPQTKESAGSPKQTRDRLSILNSDVLYLPGPGQKVAGLLACTVIRPDDLADKILDREKHPEWQGERRKMVYAFPTNEQLWAEYSDLMQNSLRAGGTGAEATKFYRKHRAEMDAGAQVAWRQNYNTDEVSAIQHAMNLKLRDADAFMAECQNEPAAAENAPDLLDANAIAEQVSGVEQGMVPERCQWLTMYIDVQQKVLFWLLCAWEENFTGYVVDYGTWPDQRRRYFTLRDARATIARAKPGLLLEAQIHAALAELTVERLGRAYQREDSAEVRVDRCLIDANWGKSTRVVYDFCRSSAFAGILMPSHGRAVSASNKPFSEYQKRRGERSGLHWRVPIVEDGTRRVRHMLIDVNHWKSTIHSMLSVPAGQAGRLSLWGDDPKAHELLAEHLTAEYPVQVSARGRTVDEWKIRPAHPDNHWLDCLVGCAVAASMLGATLPGTGATKRKKRERVDFGEWQRRAREGKA